MEIIIHVQTKTKDRDIELAIEEYVKRISPFCKIIIKKYKKPSTPVLAKNSYVCSVSAGRNTISSTELSDKLNSICLSGFSCIEFILSEDLIFPAEDYDNFNLCSFLMSKELTTVALIEQIYRAYTILNHITYHK